MMLPFQQTVLQAQSAFFEEDNFNFEALPKVLQVKNFGKRGRTKYTHLMDQDTTGTDDHILQFSVKKS